MAIAEGVAIIKKRKKNLENLQTTNMFEFFFSAKCRNIEMKGQEQKCGKTVKMNVNIWKQNNLRLLGNLYFFPCCCLQ